MLFVIPWDDFWIIGTTDTAWDFDLAHPAASKTDIDYLLGHVNRLLKDPLDHRDVIGVWAGLRPLLKPMRKEGEMGETTKLSREHTVANPVPGLVLVAGGKLTTYRVMAKDAVDHALEHPRLRRDAGLDHRPGAADGGVGLRGPHQPAGRAEPVVGPRRSGSSTTCWAATAASSTRCSP